MDGTMRGIWFAALACSAALLAAAAPADARDRELGGTLSVSGGVTLSWHGDPARGCGAAGLCGYSGAIAVRPDDGEYDFIVNGRGGLVDGFGVLNVFLHSPVVRVTRTEAGGEQGGCVDVTSGSLFELRSTRAGGRRVHIGLGSTQISSGRCAGPDLTKLVPRLPRRTRSLPSLIRGGAPVDFSGTFPYRSGRFSGTLRSTLRVRFGKPTPDRSSPGFPAPGHGRPLRRVAHLSAVYRVSELTGSLSTQFAGLTEAPCADFDACGVTGSSRWDVAGHRGTFVVDGDAFARRGDHGLGGALRAIRRRGAFLTGDGDLARNLGTTSADVSRPDGAHCHDTASVGSPGLTAFESRRRFILQLGGDQAIPAPADLLRAGCPGPRDRDAIGSGPAATGSIPLSAIGHRTLQVRMRGSASFAGQPYSGSRSADFALGLRLVSLRAGYRRARSIG
jgi:hypothetical protein